MSKASKIVKYTASWCGPCKALDAELDKLEGEIEIERVDIETEEGRKQANDNEVRALPTMQILDEDGEVIKTLTGLVSDVKIRDELKGENDK